MHLMSDQGSLLFLAHVDSALPRALVPSRLFGLWWAVHVRIPSQDIQALVFANCKVLRVPSNSNCNRTEICNNRYPRCQSRTYMYNTSLDITVRASCRPNAIIFARRDAYIWFEFVYIAICSEVSANHVAELWVYILHICMQLILTCIRTALAAHAYAYAVHVHVKLNRPGGIYIDPDSLISCARVRARKLIN